MGSQFCLEPFRTDRGSILITGAMGNEGFVRNIQSEFAIFAGLANLKCVFARERFSLEANILN